MTREQFVTLVFAIVAIGFLLCIVVSIMGAQQPAPASPYYQPTESQAKDLRIAQLTRQNAQQQVALANQNLQFAFQNETAVGAKIRDENVADAKLHWPKTVEYDLNTGGYVDHPKPTDAKPEEKKP